VALLHNYTLHKSGQNYSRNPRRAFSVNYIDGNTQINVEALEVNSSAALQKQGHSSQAAGGLSEGGENFPRIF
jgi:hypothetical protein